MTVIAKVAHSVAKRVLPSKGRSWYRWLEVRRRWEEQKKKDNKKAEQPIVVSGLFEPPPIPPRPRHPKTCHECEKIPLSRFYGPRVSG